MALTLTSAALDEPNQRKSGLELSVPVHGIHRRNDGNSNIYVSLTLMQIKSIYMNESWKSLLFWENKVAEGGGFSF
jgi:hypothetical protein